MATRLPQPLTAALLTLEARTGTHELQFTASWANETETGSMSPAAATFWSTRADMLYPCKDSFEVLEELESEWDEEEDGDLPIEDGELPSELDPNLEDGECDVVYQGINICLPLDLFCDGAALTDARRLQPEPNGRTLGQRNDHTRFQAVKLRAEHGVEYAMLPLQEFVSWSEAAVAEEVSAARRRLSWATACAPATAAASGPVVQWLVPDLIERVGRAHQAPCAGPSASVGDGLCIQDPETANDFFFPPPLPCTWEHTMGWKGADGTAFLQVRGGAHLSVGALLRRELSACVGWMGGELFCKELEIPDGETVQWDLGRSKCAEMLVTPPAVS